MYLQFTFILACFLTIFAAESSTPPPSKILDLSNFKLELPDGSTSVKNLDSYSSKYFYTDPADNRTVNFWTPEDGSVSSNGAGPRTELSEKTEFTFSGKHSMVFTQQVFEADPKGEVCIGQVKGDSFNANFVSEFVDPVGSAIDYSSVPLNSTLMASCLIVVELIYNAKSKEVTAHFRDSACNSKSVSVGQFSLGETIKMSH